MNNQDRLGIGKTIYFIEAGERIFKKKVVKGKNDYTGFALETRGRLTLEELDENWDWKKTIFFSEKDVLEEVDKRLQDWENEELNSKEKTLEFLYECTVWACLSDLRREKLREVIVKQFGIDVSND